MKTCPHIDTQPLSEALGQQVVNTDYLCLLDLDEASIISLFQSEGVLLFRGFEPDVDIFTKFSNKFSQNFLDYTGGVFNRRSINGDTSLLSVNDFKHEIKLHGEMYYQKTIPLMLWFFCVQPAAEQGETIICDGKRFFDELSEALKQQLAEKKLKYRAHLDKATWTKQYKTHDLNGLKKICENNEIHVHPNPDESVDLHYICPAVHPSQSGKLENRAMIFINSLLAAKSINPSGVCFEDGAEIDEQMMAELNQIAEKITVEIHWQKGDILMVDNTRIMHGRRAFSDENRTIYLRLCSPSFADS